MVKKYLACKQLNFKSFFRCLIENDVEVNCVDDQGRTPAHYAASAGGLDALKVLAHNDVDVNSRDTVGFVPAHHAAANNNCSCLVFLLGSGLATKDVRDRTGKSLLHVVRLLPYRLIAIVYVVQTVKYLVVHLVVLICFWFKIAQTSLIFLFRLCVVFIIVI